MKLATWLGLASICVVGSNEIQPPAASPCLTGLHKLCCLWPMGNVQLIMAPRSIQVLSKPWGSLSLLYFSLLPRLISVVLVKRKYETFCTQVNSLFILCLGLQVLLFLCNYCQIGRDIVPTSQIICTHENK